MKWGNIVSKSFPLLLAILLIAYFTSGWGAIPEALVAYGTILLAYATYRLGRISKEQNDRLIAENKEKENRDRKERLLNEIIEWAVDVFICGRVPDMVYMAVIDRSDANTLGRDISYYLLQRLNASKIRSVYIRGITSQFSVDLRTAVKLSEIRLDQHIRLLQLVAEGKAKSIAVGIHRRRLDESARNVIEIAVRLKLNP